MSAAFKSFLVGAGLLFWVLAAILFPSLSSRGLVAQQLVLALWGLLVFLGAGCVCFALVAPSQRKSTRSAAKESGED